MAEVLYGLCRFPGMSWIVPYERWPHPPEILSQFFSATKRLHNTLQGEKDFLSPSEQSVYEKVNREVWPRLEKELGPYGLIVVHDPQPASLIPLIRQAFPRKHLLWRCHIDLSDPNPETWQYLSSFVNKADAAIFHSEEFVPKGFSQTAVVMSPSIDPDSLKNRPLDRIPKVMARRILAQYRGRRFSDFFRELKAQSVPVSLLQETSKRAGELSPKLPLKSLVRRLHGIGENSRYVLQVSRYDIFKDPVGVVEAYTRYAGRSGLAASRLPFLVYAGALVNDDPEGTAVYREVARTVSFIRGENPALAGRILPLILPSWDREANAAEVNALQRGAAVVMQKSVAEGFGLTISEALWKERPVIAGDVGGLRRQVIQELNGYLVGSIYEAAEALDHLLSNPRLGRSMGKVGKELVRRKYLVPVHYERYLRLHDALEDPELRHWMLSKQVLSIEAVVSKMRRSAFLKGPFRFRGGRGGSGKAEDRQESPRRA